jgi:hypothetical protein
MNPNWLRTLRSPLTRAWLLNFAARSLLGWVVALPVIGAVSASGLGALPESDRALFEPPGFWLLELVLQAYRVLGASVRTSAIYWLFALAIQSVPTALLMAVAAAPDASFAENVGRAWRSAWRFAAIGLLELLVGALLLLLASVAAEFAQSSRTDNERWAVFGPVAVGIVVLAVFVLVAVFFDASRSASLFSGLRASAAQALSLLRVRGLELAASYFWFLAAGVLVVAGAARLSEVVDVGRPGALRVAGVLLLHQLALLALSGIEALWVRRLSSSGRA